MPYLTFGQLSATRRNNFDFLRFLFASLVILSHSYLLLRSDAVGADPLWFATGKRMSFGALAVAGFFAISGFLITQSWLRSRSVSEYLRKRVLRIYPGWIVALLFGIFVTAPILRMPPRLELGGFEIHHCFDKLLLHDLGSGQVAMDVRHGLPDVVNGSIWTIPYELLCYLGVIAFGVLGLFRKPLAVLALTLTLLGFVVWQTRTLSIEVLGPFPVPYFSDLRQLPAFGLYFLCGMTFYLFRDRIPHSPWLFAASAALVALTLFHGPLARSFWLLPPTCGFYVLFYLAFLPLGSLHAWAKHGDLSYGIYLYAWPMQKIVMLEQFRGYHLTPWTLFLAAWSLACVCAVLSWRFVERPFLRLKPRSAGLPPEDAGVPAVPAGEAQPH